MSEVVVGADVLDVGAGVVPVGNEAARSVVAGRGHLLLVAGQGVELVAAILEQKKWEIINLVN